MNEKIFMLCESITEAEAEKITGDRYSAEMKYDGERIMAFIKDRDVLMLNRRGKVCNFHFQEVEAELKLLPNCIIDGEIITKGGKFEELQSRALTTSKLKQEYLKQKFPCVYMVFDILQFEGRDVRIKHLFERRQILRNLLLKKGVGLPYGEGKPAEPSIIIADFGTISIYLQKAKEQEAEGIIIKDAFSLYEARRSKAWLKCKRWKEAEITLQSYAVNPAGIRAETKEGIAVQVAGKQSQAVKHKIDTYGFCDVFVQYLTKTDNNKMRFISFRGLK